MNCSSGGTTMFSCRGVYLFSKWRVLIIGLKKYMTKSLISNDLLITLIFIDNMIDVLMLHKAKHLINEQSQCIHSNIYLV